MYIKYRHHVVEVIAETRLSSAAAWPQPVYPWGGPAQADEYVEPFAASSMIALYCSTKTNKKESDLVSPRYSQSLRETRTDAPARRGSCG